MHLPLWRRHGRGYRPDYELSAETVLDTVSGTTRIIFLCSPNSPTGNLLDRQEIETILQLFEGIVVVDESYIDFAPQASVLELLNKYKNLIIIRSFSHAWSLAGLHLSAIVAHPEVIEEITKIGLTHPVSTPVIEQATQCQHIYHSDANFLLVRFTDSAAIYKYLLRAGIATYPIKGCLRISIGLPTENSELLGALRRL